MRHIDADKLLESVTKNDFNDWLDYDIFQHLVEEAPTADVVPKSEVDRVYYNLQAVLEERAETKREIAREIFEFIECAFSPVLVYNGYTVKKYLAELKKKYTEGKDEQASIQTDHKEEFKK